MRTIHHGARHDRAKLDAWQRQHDRRGTRTATVWAPPGVVYEYSVLYYGDWMARHERSHVNHMARILKELSLR